MAAARCLGNDDLSDAERSALRELLADGVGLGMEMGVQGPVGEEDGGLSVRIEVAQVGMTCHNSLALAHA